MATLKELKVRIGSVASSEKITGAMKMISSAKVHKEEQNLKRLKPFKDQIKSIMGHILSTGVEFNSPLIEEREVKSVALVVYGSDDGLCGAYNINIFKGVLTELSRLRKEYGDNCEIKLIPVGDKMLKACSHLKDETVKVDNRKLSSKMSGEEVTSFTKDLRDSFLNSEYDLVETAYMAFRSMSKQTFTVEQLFPVSEKLMSSEEEGVNENQLYIFEPSANSIFNEVLPMFVMSTMQEITVQNRASEQAARVMAMQSANDNAKKLFDELQLEYNKLRQQSITTELLDILGGQVEK